MSKLTDYLNSLPAATCVREATVTIEGKAYQGAAYHDVHDSGNAMRFYLLGDLPACYRRSSRTAFVIDGEDWYVACYMQSEATMRDPRYAPYHPCGKNFMLCRWQVPSGEAIDRWEDRPYHRAKISVS